jgi:peptidoglycan hydrolase-like protein with peptidoglycan-binding domain
LRYVSWLAGLLCLLALASAGPVSAARLALVIGNDNYAALPNLQKAANDARAVGGALERLGFRVFLGSNLTRRQTNRLLSDFETAIQPGDETLFFFAGHGVAMGAENYLIPSDMPQPKAGEEGLIRDESHAVHDLIDRFQRRGATSAVFILDACRDNPFAATGVRSIGATRGLARVAAPRGVFVLFSAGVGQAALDRLSDADADQNSVFTRKLVPLLETPGLTHVRLAKQLQQQVSSLARTVAHDQQPAYYDQIIGDLVLNPQSPAKQTAQAGSGRAAEAWNIIQNTNSQAVLKAYIEQFPDSIYAGFARARLTELQPDEATDAGQRLVAVEPRQAPAETVDPPSAETPQPVVQDRRELIRDIQARLNWHRCDAGPEDGLWGGRSERAVKSFARHAGLSLAAVPSDSLLDILNSRNKPTCPVAVTAPAQPEPRQAEKKVREKKVVITEDKPSLPPSRTYRAPQIGGLPVDICMSPFKSCKGQAASAYCRTKGYRVASASQQRLYPATRHIAGGTVCKPAGLVVCGGYSSITCAR